MSARIDNEGGAAAVAFLATFVVVIVSAVDALACLENQTPGSYQKISNDEYIEEKSNTTVFKACIVGFVQSELKKGFQSTFVMSTGSTLVNHYSNELKSSFCEEGYEIMKVMDEAWVTNFSCDQRVYVAAYICKKENCNHVKKLPFYKTVKEATDNQISTICPAEDYRMPNGITGRNFTYRDYVINCFSSKDENGVLWGLNMDVHDATPLFETHPARACIIGYEAGGKGNVEDRGKKLFRQSPIVMEFGCEQGIQALREEEKKQEKARHDAAIKAGEGTGGAFRGEVKGAGLLSVGVVLENFECEGVYWEKAFVCNFDACNVDNGCHGIPMQFKGMDANTRTCSPTCS